MMSAPHVWLKAAIEAAYAGLTAWPVENTAGIGNAGYDPPYVIYRRESTSQEILLGDAIGSGPALDQFPPLATFSISVFAPSYVTAWAIADAITASIHKFRDLEDDETIEAAYVLDRADGDVTILEGSEQPTYTVELSVEIRFREE